ncbi:hypothetical protein C0033_14920 [Clostridium sp. chh4-2]|uniref:sensor histidine kinase n=1 Tax=Clostridium sp. chh4-2 TaxID=2067550 RepID=UPI000CCFA79D|nr:sensor histidine kinase [Clostridium sp. chh4-2]PNV61276.1 hypothetical protein C0033_14920 [Clostridium sp. chh4-2]
MSGKFRMTIQKKTSAGIAVLILILTLIGNSFVYQYCYKLLVGHRSQQDAGITSQCAMGVQTVLQDTQFLAQNIAVSPIIQDFLKIPEPDYYQIETMNQEIKNMIKLRLYIRSAVLICRDGVYWSYSPYEDYFKGLLNEEWYQEMAGRNQCYSRIHPIKIAKERDFITYRCYIADSNTPVLRTGELLLNLDAAQFDTVMKGFFGDDRKYLIYDGEKGVPIAGYMDCPEDIGSALKEGSKSKYIEGCYQTEYRDGYVTYQKLEPSGWIVAAYTSKEEIERDAEPIRRFFFLYTPLTVLVVGMAVFLYIRQIIAPVALISRAMQEFAAGGKPELSIRTGDELELLSCHFNDMVKSIDEHVKQKIQDERIKKKIKFDMLMSKIHPHFLYNTLSSVIYLARRNGDKDIETMVKSLILILQDSMAAYEGQITAPLSQELGIVDAYGAIQSYRYKDKFEIIYNINPDVKGAFIPKNILQPLVENAIYHGIAPSEESGVVEISAEQENNMLRICVSDTGVGMEEELRARLITGVESRDGGVHSIGLGSIRDRLEYLYGENYSFEVYSEKGKGTMVLICIPYMEEPADESGGEKKDQGEDDV